MNLADVTNLRSLTVWVDFQEIGSLRGALLQTLHTITSSFFSELILVVGHIYGTIGQTNSAWSWWGTLSGLDEMLNRMDVERRFRVVIKAEEADKVSKFITQVRRRLPLMVARGKLVFEIGPFPEK